MILRILCISAFFGDFSLAFFFGGQGFFSSTKHRNAAGKACLSSVLIKPQFFCTLKSRWESTSRWVIYIKYFINNQRVKIQPYYCRALQRNLVGQLLFIFYDQILPNSPPWCMDFFFHSFQQNAELLTTLLAHNFGHKFDVWFSWAGQQLGKNFKLQLRAGFCSLTTGQMANLLIC